MRPVDPYFHRYIGKTIKEANDEVEAEAKKHGWSVNVLDKTFPQNIDVDPKRLNLFVDDEFRITKIFLA